MRTFCLGIGMSAWLFFCSPASALTMTIEDQGLSALPPQVRATVQADKSFAPFRDLSCKLRGEKTALGAGARVTTYFLTTAGACGWGAALGPIWLVRASGDTASVVLSTGGYSVEALNDVKNGMRDVKVGGGSAASTTLPAIYEYDGREYKIRSSSRAEAHPSSPSFAAYPAVAYTGSLCIPSYYVREAGGLWRDDMGKQVAPVEINFAGRYYIGLHSCGTGCRYFTLSDLSSGRDSKALDMFSSEGGEPTRTKDGRTYVTELIAHPESTMLIARYHIEPSADHPAECRERLFVLSDDGQSATPITGTMLGCR
jgi:hypothetical protein